MDSATPGTCQRNKNYVREARVRLELGTDPSLRSPALHRRFEVTPGAQAQVDWGDEAMIDTPTGRRKVYSFHMTLSYSRDPTPTLTVVRRHVAPRQAVPLHPQAAAFAQHYGFEIDVLAAYRPTGKGRVERQVLIAREHVLAGRDLTSLAEYDAASARWVPIRRAQVHRTHGEVIGVRAARDHAALGQGPARLLLVACARKASPCRVG